MWRLIVRTTAQVMLVPAALILIGVFGWWVWQLVTAPPPPPPPLPPQDRVQVVNGYGQQVAVYCLKGYHLRVDRTESQEHALVSCILEGATVTPALPRQPTPVR